MSYIAVAGLVPQYDEQSGYWLKFYRSNTTTPILMSIDKAGTTTLAKAQLDIDGFTTTDGNTLFIPFIDQRYDAFLFLSETDADNNNTINGIRVAKDIAPGGDGATGDLKKVRVDVTEDVVTYNYPSEVTNVHAIVFRGQLLQETDLPPQYINNPTAKTFTLSEVPSAEDGNIEVWGDLASFSIITLPIGDIGNPYIYTDLHEFVNNIPYLNLFSDGDWIQVDGRTIADDGGFAKYQVTNVAPTIRRNYENYIPLDVDGDSATLWAVLKEGFKRNFKEQAIEIIAHRSFNLLGVQNTELNDGEAMKYNVQSLETDVQVTSDGVLVRYHDDTVDADTDGTGAIKDLTYAAVRALIFDVAFSASTRYQDRVKIARFDDFVKFAKSVGARIYPEIKQYRTIADIQLMIDVIEANSYESMTVMQSFLIDDLVEVRRINKRVGVGWLTRDIITAQEYIDFDKLQKLKYADVLHREGNLIDLPSTVDLIYDAGVGLAAWGLENNSEINKLLVLGVYRQMLDQPQLIASVRGLQNVNY